MRTFDTFDGRNVTPGLPVGGVVFAKEDDCKSVMSSLSTMSTVDLGRLDAFWNTLRVNFKTTSVSAPKLPKEASKLERIEKYAAAVVASHNGLMQMAVGAKADLKAILDALDLTDIEKDELNAAKITGQALILKKIAEEQKELFDAKTNLVKSKKTAAIWKGATIVTSGVLAIVVGVLTNIIWTHGFETLWENNFFTKV
jgi:uncharacterized membrane protein (DUF106 family)